MTQPCAQGLLTSIHIKMADDFGLWELHFPSSRAVDDDEEEDEEITPEKEKEQCPDFIWSPKFVENIQSSASTQLECSLLILGVGEVSTTFLCAHLLCGGNSEITALITDKKTDKEFESLVRTQNSEKNCFLHRLIKNTDVLVCQIPKQHVEQEKPYYWSKKIFECMKPSKVVILTSSPACEYSTPRPWDLKADFVKMLATKEWTENCTSAECGCVETPNTVRGLPAAILSHCQVYGLPAAIFVCYTESAHMDVQSVEAFKVLFGTDSFSTLKKSSTKETSKVLKSIGMGSSSDSNMYM